MIGGESIYRQLGQLRHGVHYPLGFRLYDADAHLPNLMSAMTGDWREKGEEQTCFDLIYSFDRYERV